MESKRVTRSQVGSHTTLRYTPRLAKRYYNLRPRKSTQELGHYTSPSNMGLLRDQLEQYLARMEDELDKTINFWLEKSGDKRNGGYYVCLARDGKVYDDSKYGWLEGRQVWMYSKLYNESWKYGKVKILKAALSGGEFLLNHIKNPEDGRCYFQVTAEGKPIKIQRTIFTECFYAIAMAELYRASNLIKYKEEAVRMLSLVTHWARIDDTQLGRPKLSGQEAANPLAVPMMLLYVIDEVCREDDELRQAYIEDEEWAVQQILKHLQRKGRVVLEKVTEEGKEISGAEGRLINPGHAIEAGWFLLQYATRTQNDELARIAIDKFIVQSFDTGWDDMYGGILYYLDASGFSPTQLEWNMKLWWPHAEALIALLMAYKETREERFMEKFDLVFQYTFSHFSDSQYGEWFGYLNQKGEVTHTFKGGPFKGCFHVPRCLHMCIKMLKELLEEKTLPNSLPNGLANGNGVV